MGNGRQIHKFSSPKNRGGILLYCAGADGNTYGRKSRGDEKQLIDLEWPNSYSTVARDLWQRKLPLSSGFALRLGSVYCHKSLAPVL